MAEEIDDSCDAFIKRTFSDFKDPKDRYINKTDFDKITDAQQKKCITDNGIQVVKTIKDLPYYKKLNDCACKEGSKKVVNYQGKTMNKDVYNEDVPEYLMDMLQQIINLGDYEKFNIDKYKDLKPSECDDTYLKFIHKDHALGWRQQRNDCWIDSFFYAIFAQSEETTRDFSHFLDIFNGNAANDSLQNLAKIFSRYLSGIDKNPDVFQCKQEYKNMIIVFLIEYYGNTFDSDVSEWFQANGNGTIIPLVGLFNNNLTYVYYNFYNYKLNGDNYVNSGSYYRGFCQNSHIRERLVENYIKYIINGFPNKSDNKTVDTIKYVFITIDSYLEGVDTETTISDIEVIRENNKTYKLISIIKGNFVHYVAITKRADHFLMYDDQNYGNLSQVPPATTHINPALREEYTMIYVKEEQPQVAGGSRKRRRTNRKHRNTRRVNLRKTRRRGQLKNKKARATIKRRK
jgi:hypothetical protein